ncbi:MAG: amphi-Trp domain-containing protein [Pseudomonadota bacterium]
MKKGIMIKTTMSPAAVVGLLEEISHSLSAGKICVESGADFVVLEPAADIEVEIGASVRKNKQKLTLDLSWKEAPRVEAAQSSFRISSRTPEVEPDVVEEAPPAAAALNEEVD